MKVVRAVAEVWKVDKLYEGKAKIVFATGDPDLLIVHYKDSATAFDGKKKGTIEGKGVINAEMSAVFFTILRDAGVPNHFERLLSPGEMLVKRLQIVPVEVVVRNIIAGSLSKRLGLPEGTGLKRPVLEFYYKSDELGDPMINEYHVYALDMATEAEMEEIARLAMKTNEALRGFLNPRNIDLVDFKLEFGRYRGGIILGDEISPDTCRFWDSNSREKLDKDRFRRDLGGVEDAYREVLRRVISA
ncbi:MAG: phosphoribosylaminoimidazolesuccinocarboxamide synthase [Ignavibacteriales bacterium]